ncbi:MAG: hypothetical protein BZ136_04110 [Methanosphaera sp. rholeuAM74]|nr:MAG: hypothetical protein BZ136_04110 [Methanosphaera sp. rholeuAM74]
MNICIVGQYPPQVGGIATYTGTLRDKLEALGHNVFVVTYPSDSIRDENVFEARVINFPVLRALTFIVSSYLILRRLTRSYDLDVIHAHYLLPQALVTTFIKSNTGARIVATAHGSDINILAQNNLMKPLVKYTLNSLDEIYFVSQNLKDKASILGVKNFDEKSYITPNTVDTDKYTPEQQNNDLKQKYKNEIVIFLGNLVEQKGIKYLLEAKKLSKRDYTLLIYGDGPLKAQIQEYIQENNIKDTHLMGKTTQAQQIIPQADIMVIPSISEGASIVALESMSCARPLISTDTGNIRDVITDNHDGLIVPPRNPEKLCQSITYLLENPEKRVEMGLNARQTIIEKYSNMKIPYI